MVNKMFRSISILFLFIVIAPAYGQYTIEDWYGVWEGELNILRYQDTVMSLPMALEISQSTEDSTHNWIISYRMEDKPEDRRAYVLKEKDTVGQFLLDELNGIQMPMNMHGNALYSVFDVMNSRLFSRVELFDSTIVYAIEPASINEGLISPADTLTGTPEVIAWPINSRHRAVLKKHK